MGLKDYTSFRIHFRSATYPAKGLSAGFVSEDNQQGINNLLSSWNKNEHSSMKENALNCFVNKMHMQNTVKKIISIFE